MDKPDKPGLFKRLKYLVIGDPRNIHDHSLYHNISLIAFFAWVGLGADGLSSSCYGPDEAHLALGAHGHLSIIIGLASAVTIFIISASYSQIIELFPTGGGGYLVASKLLSPKIGMISGCALIIDYVLTITLSIASGADALFSFLPQQWLPYRLAFAIGGLVVLILLNLRGVRESVIPLIPIFLTFVITHAFAIGYAVFTRIPELGTVVTKTVTDIQGTSTELGAFGMLLLLMRAYSMGAGTYTGIEAVSNGIPILREPKVATARRTMTYMAISLAVTVMGLMTAYVLFEASHQPGKTLNAVLFAKMTMSWNPTLAETFILVTLVSEAAILFIAAQAGFLDGPRVLASMALDRWLPTRYAMLSDRLVTQNGVLLMGIAALVTMVLTGGSVRYLVVLYSINVFITFSLSQLGMVIHWWKEHGPRWKRRLLVNGIGLSLTFSILCSVVFLKFYEGGWITLVITGGLATIAILIKRHYNGVAKMLAKLNVLMDTTGSEPLLAGTVKGTEPAEPDFEGRTAVILVGGFNGVGLHTLFSIVRLMGDGIKNYVFLQVGQVDAGNFKGSDEMDKLKKHTREGNEKYIKLLRANGLYAEGYELLAVDVVDEIAKFVPRITGRFPRAMFFGGQLVFPKENITTRILHNYITFAVQRRLYLKGIPFMIIPIRL
ncbi:MAG: APC family permease [Myxococcota bacterium]|jgi:amino acid transporter